mmetsp:Transcript_50923/g.146299  ORF Transcript_50923/g.146299 Transcript_50923/m.146299 type:complete len:270 (-) Transcript_50923:324-1133(-)
MSEGGKITSQTNVIAASATSTQARAGCPDASKAPAVDATNPLTMMSSELRVRNWSPVRSQARTPCRDSSLSDPSLRDREARPRKKDTKQAAGVRANPALACCNPTAARNQMSAMAASSSNFCSQALMKRSTLCNMVIVEGTWHWCNSIGASTCVVPTSRASLYEKASKTSEEKCRATQVCAEAALTQQNARAESNSFSNPSCSAKVAHNRSTKRLLSSGWFASTGVKNQTAATNRKTSDNKPRNSPSNSGFAVAFEATTEARPEASNAS